LALAGLARDWRSEIKDERFITYFSRLMIDTPWGCVVECIMKSKQQRLNNVIGQIEGIKKMMEGNSE
jgi:hypothetical protein